MYTKSMCSTCNVTEIEYLKVKQQISIESHPQLTFNLFRNDFVLCFINSLTSLGT